jgi:AcrR family transcriptional regulator
MADLNAERIAAAALAVASKRGVAGFTMRAIAAALGVTPMALYHHVRDKAELAALLVNASIRKHPLPPPTGDWRDDLFAMAQWTREHAHSHPVVAHLRREYQIWTPAMLQMTERWLSLWQQSGLDLQQATLAATMSSMAITGLVGEETLFRTMKRPGDSALNSLPNVRAMFKAEHNRHAEFELVVRSLIDGLHARLAVNRNVSPRAQSLNSSRRIREDDRNESRTRAASRKRANRRNKD